MQRRGRLSTPIRMRRVLPIVLALAAMAATAQPAFGYGGAFAPVNRPGPALDVPLGSLQASLNCQPSVKDANVEPVLLNPGTGMTGDQQYGGNWEPALTAMHIPWCSLAPPYYTDGNVETAGEYIVYAIRTMYHLAGRPIAILGHSQGGMSMRWALRFWPDTRPMVADVIGLAGDNHGSLLFSQLNAVSCSDGCPPENYQQATGSHFLSALNSGAETFAGISYTEIYTYTDEIVDNTPPLCSSCLTTGGGQIANIPIQPICPNDAVDHLRIYTDYVAYELALDAISHPGPAVPARLSPDVCLIADDDSANPLRQQPSDQNLAGLLPVVGGGYTNPGNLPLAYSEPPLACYVFANCPAADLRAGAGSGAFRAPHPGMRLRPALAAGESAELGDAVAGVAPMRSALSRALSDRHGPRSGSASLRPRRWESGRSPRRASARAGQE